MVELLISSDIAKYCEFKTVTRVLTVLDGKVEKVSWSMEWTLICRALMNH